MRGGAGRDRPLGLTVNETGWYGPGVGGVEEVRATLRQSRLFWWNWANGCTYEGPYQDHVTRCSALVLKLMTYAPDWGSGRRPHHEPARVGRRPRNWDYRFTWLPDASFTLYALFQLTSTARPTT